MASQPTTVMTMPMLMVPMAPIIGTASNDEQIGAGQRLGVDTGLLERELFRYFPDSIRIVANRRRTRPPMEGILLCGHSAAPI